MVFAFRRCMHALDTPIAKPMTRLWSEHWEDIVSRYLARPRLFVACDLDGTLAPAARALDRSELSDEMRCLLRKLAASSGIMVAFVSERPLNE